MTKHTAKQGKHSVRPGFAGLAALVLCAVLLFLPARPVQAAEWMQPYLEQVREWGVMYGDSTGNLHEDRPITRAELVVMMNRAFGYTEPGPNPFTDVSPSDWFAEDICIAHQAGYFNGTSPTTASPRNYVTREQAAALLGRCLRLQGTSGATTNFHDGYTISPSFRGLVQEAAELGIIQGYADGNFRPKARITRGQVACFLVRALGTLVQEPGEQISGGVYGNLTINRPGVKLKDTVITGNLYLTGGVGLGNVELENVTVMGKIVLCGGGTSEKGENSVVLRNVTADALEVDSLAGQFLSVRAEGLTDIGKTTVRTSSYLEDVTETGLGLQLIHLDGSDGSQMQLAGNIKEVVNLTPGSTLQIAQGVADVVTMDEKAVGATLDIANMASIRKLNLDAGVPVTGAGSVSHMNINANGASTSMLPDTVEVRPGVTANVKGQVMDTVGAAESSEDPRLLAGYPSMKNVASTTADAVFRTNKPGTIYWALTALIDGSVGEDALIAPSTNARIIRSGTLNAATSNTDVTVRQTNLTRDGSYYISAMLVDNRGRRSPVKTVAFTTPDDTTPNFANGYPYTILTEGKDREQVIQAMVMPTKDCQLYYVLLPNNSAAPTPADLRAGAVSGSLGFGVIDVKKNVPHLIPRVNSSYLEEQTTYSLYLWLNDADNNKSSAIRRLDVTTLDKTPPTIVSLRAGDSGTNSCNFTVSLDEPGTLYWAVVKQGDPFYARVPDGTSNGRVPDPEELVAKIQVESGTNSLRRGQVNIPTAGTTYPFVVSGLEGQTRYDLYYVAKDRAGNYNVYTKEFTPPLTFSTLDNQAPTVKQLFDGIETTTPAPDAEVQLVFSETVQGVTLKNGETELWNFLELYNSIPAAPASDRAAKKAEFGEILHQHIELHYYSTTSTGEVNVRGAPGVADNDWVIDFREAVVSLATDGSGQMVITFPSGTGIDLDGGMTYFFRLKNIRDTSPARNLLQGSDMSGIATLPQFTTVEAQLRMFQGSDTGLDANGNRIDFDMNFKATPQTASNASDETMWDMIFWTNHTMAIDLYSRKLDGGGWVYEGNARFSPTSTYPTVGVSYVRTFRSKNDATNLDFEQLKNWQNTEREYGIVITELNGIPSDRRGEWASGEVKINVQPIAGSRGSLRGLINGSLTPDIFDAYQAGNTPVKLIGVPPKYEIKCPIQDTTPPVFISNSPTIEVNGTDAKFGVMLNHPGTFYYVIAEIGTMETQFPDGDTIDGRNDIDSWMRLPENGRTLSGPNVTLPSKQSIYRPSVQVIDSGSGKYSDVLVSFTPKVSLAANTKYVIYFVLQGGPEVISDTYALRFETTDPVRPQMNIKLSAGSGTGTTQVAGVTQATIQITNQKESEVYYALVSDSTKQVPFTTPFQNCISSEVWNSLSPANKTLFSGMNALEAMQSPVNGYSYFDQYADPTIRSVAEIARIIQTGGSYGSDQVYDQRSTTLSPSNDYTTSQREGDFAGTVDTYPSYDFWLVAIARRTSTGTDTNTAPWVFRSASFLQNNDNKPPKLVYLGTDITNVTESPAGNRYSGSLSIRFSEALWFLPDTGDKTHRLKVIDIDISGNVPDGRILSSQLLPSSSSVPGIDSATFTVRPSGNTGDCQELTIMFSNCGVGSTLHFVGNLCDVRGNTGNPGLSIRMVPSETPGGNPEFATTGNIALEWGSVRG